MKTAVRVKFEKTVTRLGGERIYRWNAFLIGASGRKLHIDTLTQNRNFYARWYESDTYTGVGFQYLYDAKQWFTKHMYSQHPEFVGSERCDICAIRGDCPNPCPIRRA